MIYLDTAVLGSKVLVKAWLKNDLPSFSFDKGQRQKIELLCNWLLEPCLDFVVKHCEQFLPCSKMHLTLNYLKLFSAMLDDMK